jgi:hypothetical protein
MVLFAALNALCLAKLAAREAVTLEQQKQHQYIHVYCKALHRSVLPDKVCSLRQGGTAKRKE